MSLRATFLAIAGLVLASVCGGIAVAQNPLERLVSPGELSNPHAKLEATCNACHETFNKGAQPAKCLACHKDINWDVQNRRGFHGRSPEVAKTECKVCHTEHEGRSRPIVKLDEAAFDHRFTDMPLLGKHASVQCAACHQKGVKHAKAPTDCVSCHKRDEPHMGRLGTACATCHVVSGWTTVSFDHATTQFALKDKHATQACSSCHVNQQWKGLQTGCVACHAKDDAHQGKLGKDCASCHAETGWKGRPFDHAKTGFALIGRHAEAKCESCHVKNVSDPLPRTCNGCHQKDDAHKGRNGPACQDCHTPKQWTSVTFDHRKTDFPLLGKHAAVKCESCHTKPVKDWAPPLACNGCHQKDDTHKGLLGPDCKTCHSESSWTKVRFEHKRDTGFALNGKHSAVTCAACHKQPTHIKAPPVNCIGCHRDDDPHKRQLGDGCGQCHGETGWKTAVRFDHDLSDFPLLGKHAGAPCADCHTSAAFLDADAACVSCHRKDDVHKGRLGPDCSTCHTPVDWPKWRFDHDVQTDFRLTGKHRGLDCASCHKAEVKGRIEQSARCVSCHAADDKHRGSFGTTCERCHTTDSFSNVTVRR